MKAILVPTAAVFLLGIAPLALVAAPVFPGPDPGPAQCSSSAGSWTLGNRVISATWSTSGGQLRPASCTDLLAQKTFPQTSRELFRVALAKPGPEPAAAPETWLGLAWDATTIRVRTSTNGRGWRTIASVPRSGFAGPPVALRLGKTAKSGGAEDYVDPGPAANPRFDHLMIQQGAQPALTEEFSGPGLPASWKAVSSGKSGAALATRDGWLVITGKAHCAAYLEHALEPAASAVTCQVDRVDDAAQSWGPGLTLAWADGKALTVNLRAEGACSVITRTDEQVISTPFQAVPEYDLASSRCKIIAGPAMVKLPAEPHHPRAGSRQPGLAVTADLRDDATGLTVRWRAVLRDGANYVREEFTLVSPVRPLTIRALELLDRTLPGARKTGTVPGSPVCAGNLFCGIELPVFGSETSTDGFTLAFPCDYRLAGRDKVAFSTVTGVVPEGQLRRGFQCYLERERARPARAYLHFNGWYDTGTGVSEKNLLAVIAAYQKELVEQRRVPVDGFVIDDGWDDAANSFWDWKKSALPQGLGPVRAAAVRAKSRLGIWISPLGGYGEAPQRIANARKQNIVSGDHLDLSEPRYYDWFRAKCLGLMRDDGIGYFKWDKAGDGVNPHFMALLKLADELHTADPGLFINVTVGTWASPFWLNHVDCTWHGGADVGWIGKGDKREQWLTYRDAAAFGNSARGPLYPLNSLMLHGMVLGHHFQGREVATAGNHLRHECRSFFATGTAMQEMYLSPDLMDAAAWDDLAAAATWARRHADVLLDSHHIGGSPAKLEPYGWASWTPSGAVIALRNPDDQPRTITLDAATAFELPPGAPRAYALRAPYADQRLQALDLAAGTPATVTLQPFEVLVFNTTP